MEEESCLVLGHSSSNLNHLVGEAERAGCRVLAPQAHQKHTPTHFPRDESRSGRQTDIMLVRDLAAEAVVIVPERRLTLSTDHALL